jgi:hypothetical protein
MEQLIESTTGPATFKDWAISCAALGEGKQVMLFRKAGIAETNDEFKVEHPRFFLYPTWIHQKPEGIKPEYHAMLEKTLTDKPPQDKNRIQYWSKVEEAVVMKDMDQIERQRANHVWSDATTAKRWDWEPERKFWMLLLRTYRLKQPFEIDLLDSYTGCFSWFSLEGNVENMPCEAVLSDAEWNAKADLVRNAL